MMPPNAFELDDLDRKLAAAFPGRIVRKDLVRQTKVGFNVPVYVLECLLGQYCASTDPEIVAKGLDYVRQTLSRNYVRADEGEKVKALTRQHGRHRILAQVVSVSNVTRSGMKPAARPTLTKRSKA